MMKSLPTNLSRSLAFVLVFVLAFAFAAPAVAAPADHTPVVQRKAESRNAKSKPKSSPLIGTCPRPKAHAPKAAPKAGKSHAAQKAAPKKKKAMAKEPPTGSDARLVVIEVEPETTNAKSPPPKKKD
jgi:hypothetical protein